jgi:hypothetical protein
MTDDSANADSPAEVSPLDEELSAYLDGELPPEQSRQVEQLLAADVSVRRRLRSLEASWGALDELHSTPLDDRFTQTTMEMVALAAHDDVVATCAAMPQQRRRRWKLMLGALLVAAGAGFALVALLRGDPDRRLLEDLPVLERLEQYRQVRDLDFLKRLATEHLFEEDHTAGSDLVAPPATLRTEATEETLPQRRQRVDALSSAEKEELRRRWELFESLEPAERQRLRDLHRELDHDPRSAELRTVMERYYKWFAALPPFRRAELLSLGTEERIKKIKSLVEEQSQKLRPQDLAGIKSWIEQYAARHDDSPLLQNLPEKSRRILDKMPAAERKQMIGMMLLTWRGPPPNAQDLADLRASLTPETQQRLEAKSPAEQWQIIAEAVRQWAHEKMAKSGMKSPFAMVDDVELARYFESGLTFEQRDRLLTLPADEMQRELRQMYLTRSHNSDGTDRWPGRVGLGKRSATGEAGGLHPGRGNKKGPGGSANRPRLEAEKDKPHPGPENEKAP